MSFLIKRFLYLIFICFASSPNDHWVVEYRWRGSRTMSPQHLDTSTPQHLDKLGVLIFNFSFLIPNSQFLIPNYLTFAS